MELLSPLQLRRERIKRGITAAHVARLMGVTRGHLCDLEHGRRTLSPENRARYQEALGMEK